MIRHFKIWVLVLGLILVAFVFYFAGSLYVGGCGYRNNCMEGGRSQFTHTPISTLIPATLQAIVAPYSPPSGSENCTVTAKALLLTWVSGGFSENQPFQFFDQNGVACEATYADIKPLFLASNLWYPGALACTACHNADLSSASSAGLDLSSYAGVVAGAHPAKSTTGIDILGSGDWQQSRLNQVLFVLRQMPVGLPANSVSQAGPIVLAGLPVSVVNATPAPTPSGEEIARPSNSGGTGEAVKLTGDPLAGAQVFVDHCQLCHGQEGMGNVLNPGTDDGTVPPLNPIDSTLLSSDYQVFMYNLDLFLQNGSSPSGPNPARLMPPWGAGNGLTQQQIADVIAYIISLNK
jgi:mono/diheme cytochrome c family protein